MQSAPTSTRVSDRLRLIQDLPWLALPTTADRERLSSVVGLPTSEVVSGLGALLGRAWDGAELDSIGRKLRQAVLRGAHDRSEIALQSGCVALSLLIISSNTAKHLVDALGASALRAGLLLDCRVVEYEDPEAWVESNRGQLSAHPPDVTLLALDRPGFQLRQVPLGDTASAEECIASALQRARRIIDLLLAATGHTVVVQTLEPDAADPQSNAEAWLEGSPRRLVSEFNRRLALAARDRSCVVFDLAAIAELVGLANWYAERYWYAAKFPFSPNCIGIYTYRLSQLLAALSGRSRRVLVLDLDNTLWGGILGDDGIEGLKLGMGSGIGEAHLAVQRMALQYKDRGVIICVASKNNEEDARQVFREHPEMLLRESDVTLFHVNWQDKPSNIAAMAETLGLGLEAFVFIDDNPAERKQLRDTLPRVAVPELPADPAAWVPVIQAASYFEQISFSAEDRARTEYYRGNAQRAVQAKKIGDPQKFLESLQMVVTFSPFNSLGRTRIAQLISKSNQFNLTTRRYSEAEVKALESDGGVQTLQIRLEDIFGDNGVISLIVCRRRQQIWDIELWIMSCRVLGRGVEQAALNLLVEKARAAGVRELHGSYVPSAKNGLVRDHYSSLGFLAADMTDEVAHGGTTRWRLVVEEFVPANVPMEIRWRPGAEI